MSPPDPQPDAGGTATPIKRGRPSRSFAAAATTASASNATTRAAAASRSPPDTQNDHADEAASATNTAFGDVYEADSGEDSSADERRARKKKRKPTDLTVVSALRFPVRSAAASQPVVHSPSLLLSTLSAAAGAAVQNNGAAVAAPPAAAATASNCNSKATGGGGGSRASKLNAALKIDEHRDTSASPPPLEGAGSYGATSGVAGAVPSSSSTPLGRFANNPIKQAATRPRAPPLDFSTVRTQGPRVPPPRTKSRTFGLEDAPTFYPTQKEFKDPMEYIRWCGDEGGAREFGICKIVPPEGWQPPFVMNTEVSFCAQSRWDIPTGKQANEPETQCKRATLVLCYALTPRPESLARSRAFLTSAGSARHRVGKDLDRTDPLHLASSLVMLPFLLRRCLLCLDILVSLPHLLDALSSDE